MSRVVAGQLNRREYGAGWEPGAFELRERSRSFDPQEARSLRMTRFFYQTPHESLRESDLGIRE
jgi:hypothetical protein